MMMCNMRSKIVDDAILDNVTTSFDLLIEITIRISIVSKVADKCLFIVLSISQIVNKLYNLNELTLIYFKFPHC